MIFLVSIITALTWHFLLQRFWVSSIGSTITAVLVTLALVSAAGHSPFYSGDFYTQLAGITGVALIISIIIGALFLGYRGKHAHNQI